jgi:hypothetical protein
MMNMIIGKERFECGPQLNCGGKIAIEGMNGIDIIIRKNRE